MKYAVDRIEENIAVLENIDTKEITKIDLAYLPIVKERDILKFENNLYIKDDDERERRNKLIREKLERLKK